MSSASLSRRSFMKAAASTLLVTGIAGTSVAIADEASDSGFSWDEETDVLIVGGGLAGMATAATVATEGNGATCILLEKGTSTTGAGNSMFSSSCVLCGDEGDEDDIFAYLQELRHDDISGTPDDVLMAYAKELCQNRQWLVSLGLSEDDYYAIGKSANTVCFPEYPELEHANSVDTLMFDEGQYGHVVMFMYSVIQDMPEITHKLGCQLTALVSDPDTKEVLGGVYECDGEEVRVKANRGVVMTCGGFEDNRDMLACYFSAPTIQATAAQMNTGDGHIICKRLGAAEWHMHAGAGFWNAMRKLDDSGWGLYSGPGYNPCKDMGITVGKNGRRFYCDWDACCTCDWDGFYAGVPLEDAAGSRHGHMEFGGDWSLLPMPTESWFVFDQDALDNGVYAKQGTDPVADGFAYTADTIEGLAEQAGISAENLVEAVDTWNTYCENGKDLSFFRPESTLTPIKKAPFYIMLCHPQILNTDGGPVRGANGEIIDLDGNPIPRLYSAGEFGSLWSGHYQGAGNLAECLAFGRISARSALANA